MRTQSWLSSLNISFESVIKYLTASQEPSPLYWRWLGPKARGEYREVIVDFTKEEDVSIIKRPIYRFILLILITITALWFYSYFLFFPYFSDVLQEPILSRLFSLGKFDIGLILFFLFLLAGLSLGITTSFSTMRIVYFSDHVKIKSYSLWSGEKVIHINYNEFEQIRVKREVTIRRTKGKFSAPLYSYNIIELVHPDNRLTIPLYFTQIPNLKEDEYHFMLLQKEREYNTFLKHKLSGAVSKTFASRY